MNATEMQAKLTKYELRHAEQRKRIDELETMLRQQQAEIEALKRRELTDDEIDELENQFLTVEDSLGFPVIMGTYEFAKAILRKAQEK